MKYHWPDLKHLPIEKVDEVIRSYGCQPRILSDNATITLEYVKDRVNVVIKNGKVIKVFEG